MFWPMPFASVRCFSTLVAHALRHTPGGRAIAVSGAVVAGAVCLTVADSGEGMAPEQLAVVFNRFYPGDPSRSREIDGNGLGLAIVEAPG